LPKEINKTAGMKIITLQSLPNRYSTVEWSVATNFNQGRAAGQQKKLIHKFIL